MTVSVSVDDVIIAISDFVSTYISSDITVVRGQVNRVSLPANPCIVLTELGSVKLATYNRSQDDDNQTATYYEPTQLNVQCDIYGSSAGDYCQQIKTLFVIHPVAETFPDAIRPLYAGDGRQMPLVTGEDQYNDRWMIDLSLQYNSSVTITEGSFNEMDSITMEQPANTI